LPVVNPDHLLDQADRLIAAPGAGARRQVDLKRAISSAYYALFHAIATAAADDLTGKGERDSGRYALAYRSIEHRSLRAICEDLQKQTLPRKYLKYQPSGGFGPDLKILSTAVEDLQERRNAADYDPLFRATTADAVSAVGTARGATRLLKSMTRSQRRAFLALVVFPARL
jgi:hypothetical protein